jgi:hypothetical protein
MPMLQETGFDSVARDAWRTLMPAVQTGRQRRV